ncbi:MAG: ABC transporter ATP-binding protein [Pseudomonadota bacterium]
MGAISLQNINKSFGETHVIKDVNIEIDDGEFTVFVGPSGCGKSTLLRLIAGLEDISSGTLRIGDRVVNDLQPKERAVAMVFQSYAIFPHMTVRENIAFGLTIRRESKADIDRKVAEAARMLKMEDLLARRPSQLSGGQRQRVAIGRAIVRDPSVFLFDEPLSNLDAALRMSTRQEIAALHAQLKTTMIYVTHDQVEAMTLADKIVVLKDGKVMQVGAPMELYHNPANLFVAGFLGAPSMNFLPVVVDAQSDETVTVSGAHLGQTTVPRQGRTFDTGQKATLGIRPQYLTPSNTGALKGKVSVSERLGTETVVELALDDGATLMAALSEDAILTAGENVAFDFDGARAHVFEETL